MTDAPNAPAPASAPDTKHAIGCAEERGVSCDCGATNAMLARLDHLRAAKQAPAAAPPASTPTAEERAEPLDDATIAEWEAEYTLGDDESSDIQLYRFMHLIREVRRLRERDHEATECIESLETRIRGLQAEAAERAHTPATTAPSETDRPCLLCGKYEPCVCWRAAEPSEDAASEVKRLADEAIKTAFVNGAWNGTGSRPEREYEGPARASHTARDGLHAAIDALADTSSVTSYTRTLERENAKLRDKLAAHASTVTAAPVPSGVRSVTVRQSSPWSGWYEVSGPCHVGADNRLYWGAEPAATAEPLCERCRLPMGPPGMRMLGSAARYCSVECAADASGATARPPDTFCTDCGHDCERSKTAKALHCEVAFYAGRTLEAEADAVDWKLKAEAAVSEVAALRADRDRDAKDAARWRAVRIVDMPRYFADWNEMGTEGRDIFADSLIDEAAARQSPASAPQPDVWYRSTIRPSSIPYLTRSIREIDEP